MPLAAVSWFAPATEPPPVATAKWTETPETGLPCASVTRTDGAVATNVFTVALWPSPSLTAIEPAVSATPVAWKVTGLPVRPADVAVSVFAPAVVPSVQLPTAAMPLAFELAFAPVTAPPPDAGAKVTEIPATGLPYWSAIRTAGAPETALPTVAVWLSPLQSVIDAALSATPVALIVTDVRPDELAVSVFAPSPVPSVQLPTVATPLASVVAFGPVTEPPPEPTEKVTATPETGLPWLSVTSTDGAVATLWFTVAVWPSPPLIESAPAAPAVPVAWKVTLNEPAVAVSVFAPAVVPSFQVPTVATPAASVVALVPVAEPPPEATAKVTAAFGTGLPNWSLTSAEGAVPTFVSAAAGTPVAWNVTLPTLAVAVSVFAPAVSPSVQEAAVATPLAFVFTGVLLVEPPPEATAKVTATPETALPKLSATKAAGAVESALCTVATWLSPADTAIDTAAPALPVALKVTLPTLAVATSVLAPAVVPSFHEPTVATPLALVVALPPVSDPLPLPIANVTATLGTALPNWSVTRADGAVPTFVFTVAPWPSPPAIAIVAAASWVPVAWNVAVPTEAVAVSVFVPAVWASFQEPTVAMPLAFVVALPRVTEPLPLATANVTPTLCTGLPNVSVTRTDGAVETFVSTVADWPSPPWIAIAVGAPATPVAVKVAV